MPAHPFVTPRRVAALLLAIPTLVGLLLLVDRDPPPARAAVVHQDGFSATVRGWSSWYGSYALGSEGPAWCVDHGLHAPDEALGYRPIALAVAPDTQAAVAWAVSRHATTDRVGAAALMLALHDLMGAQYPFGPLDVQAMGLGDLAGFGGLEGRVLDLARRIESDGRAHGSLRGPLRLEVVATPVDPGTEDDLVVAVRDANGRGVDGVVVDVVVSGATALTETSVATGADGRALVRYRAAEGRNRFDASALAPDPSVHAWGPVGGGAQRVVRPATVVLADATEFEARPPTGLVVVEKTGEADAYLAPSGAVFEAHHPSRGPVMTFVTGPDGRSPAAALPPGPYRLVEIRPPDGYDIAPPVDLEVHAGDTTVVEVVDPAERTDLVVEKIDAGTRQPLGGARIRVAYDADRSGDYETEVAVIRTGDEPTTVGSLLPGDYEISELEPPPHHLGLDEPIRVTLDADGPGHVLLENLPTTSVSFEKVPEARPPSDASLAGAIFEVHRSPPDQGADGPDDGTDESSSADARPGDDGARGDDRAEKAADADLVGSCETDASGRCGLPPDTLVGGSSYCWRETRAPTGFAVADGACFTATQTGATIDITVVEPLLRPPSSLPPSTTVPPTATAPPAPSPPRPPVESPPSTPPSPHPGLPVTGTDAATTTAAGLVLVGSGTLVTRAARRRRGSIGERPGLQDPRGVV